MCVAHLLTAQHVAVTSWRRKLEHVSLLSSCRNCRHKSRLYSVCRLAHVAGAQVVFNGSIKALAAHIGSTNAHSKVAQLMYSCAKERVVSVTRSASLALKGAEAWRSYDVPGLVTSASMDPKTAGFVVTRGRRLVSHTMDYDLRPTELAGLCEYTMTALYYKVAGRGGLKFNAAHPQHRTHVLEKRETLACPALYGVPHPQSERWGRFVEALFTPGRTGGADETKLGDLERRVVSNVRARLLAPRDLPTYFDAGECQDDEPAKKTFAPAVPPPECDYTRAAVAAVIVPSVPAVTGPVCQDAPLLKLAGEQIAAMERQQERARDVVVDRGSAPDALLVDLPRYTAEQMRVEGDLDDGQRAVADQIVNATANFATRDKPLRLLVQGEAGTGKSKVIGAALQALRRLGLEDTVLLTAYTGAAAQLLARTCTTAHTTSAAFKMGYKVPRGDVPWPAAEQLQLRWARVRTLVVDEISFVSEEHNGAMTKRVDMSTDAHEGGMPWNVVYVGDFFQHAPPGCSALFLSRVLLCCYLSIRDVPLFCRGTRDLPLSTPLSTRRTGGKPLYDRCAAIGLVQFVGWAKATLRVNYRILKNADGALLARFLSRLRAGEVDSEDIVQLNERVAGTRGVPTLASLENYRVLALRHAVIERVLEPMVTEVARRAGRQLLRWSALDSTTMLRDPRARNAGLQAVGYFFAGMRAIASGTVDAARGFVNNTELELVAINLHPDEEPLPSAATSPVVTLKHMPICVHVRVCGRSLCGVARDVMGVVPVERPSRESRLRRQLPFRPAVVITDYCAQGATFEPGAHVVIDITRPPSGSLCYHALYVSLSRFRVWSQVVLLRAILAGVDAPWQRGVDIAQLVRSSIPPKNVIAAQWWIEHPDASTDVPQEALLEILERHDARSAEARLSCGRAARVLRRHATTH